MYLVQKKDQLELDAKDEEMRMMGVLEKNTLETTKVANALKDTERNGFVLPVVKVEAEKLPDLAVINGSVPYGSEESLQNTTSSKSESKN